MEMPSLFFRLSINQISRGNSTFSFIFGEGQSPSESSDYCLTRLQSVNIHSRGLKNDPEIFKQSNSRQVVTYGKLKIK